MTPIARIFAAAAALAAMATAGAAVAQDYNANPNYGTVSLTAGFTPDPHVTNLQAGGNLNASDLSSSCRGTITNAPDLRLNYTAGSFPLIFSVSSNSDTTLVVNGPDGSWYCDDDGGVNGLNPAVRFASPTSGRYEIWVGTYNSGATQPAQLVISELDGNTR